MARKKTELGPKVQARIAELTRQGSTVEIVTAEVQRMGCDVSASTITRRMRELRGAIKTQRSSAFVPPPEDDVPLDEIVAALPAEIPDGASTTELNALLARCKRGIEKAETAGNLPLMSNLIRTAAQLTERIAKATPPPPPNPDDNPDMVKLGKQVAERLLKMIGESLE